MKERRPDSAERERSVKAYSALSGPIYHKGGGSYKPRRSHGYSARYGDLGALRRFHPTEEQKQQEERLDP
jgi:hypothetical protein